MHFIFIFLISAFFLNAQAVSWTALEPKPSLKSKARVWQVPIVTNEGKAITYLIHSTPAKILIFNDRTRYHHLLDLRKWGIKRITDVGLDRSLANQGKVIYLGNQRNQKILSITLGEAKITSVILSPGLKAYKEFIARLHPVAETERYL